MPLDARIQFRFGKAARHYHDELVRRAARIDKTPNEYARDLLIQALETDLTDELHALRAGLAEQSDETQNLRSDLATVLEMLLIHVAKRPEDEVRAFVSKYLRRRGAS